MIRAERETVIIANLADLDEGYFTVETTEKAARTRLQKLPGISLLSFSGGVYLYRVPSAFWGNLSVRRRRVCTPKMAAAAEKARGKQSNSSPDTP